MKHSVLASIISILFLSLSNMVSAQIEIKNPEITPMSPEASKMARYGDLDLTGATGQMRYSIPIYNIAVDGNSWPISLNYSYNGLILEGKPSLSGLGWQLSGYATITKEARGLPDGHPEGYYGESLVKDKIDLAVSDYLSGAYNNISFHDLKKFRDGVWDSELDKYTLSVNGETISFKVIDDNGTMKAYHLSRNNYIITPYEDGPEEFEVLRFEVVDDKGIMYFFNQNHRERYKSDPVGSSKFWKDKTTAWMLSEIQYGNGQSITFTYEENEYVSYNFSANGYENDLDISTIGQNPTSIPVQNWSIGYHDEIREVWMDRQILTGIQFPQGSIDLDITPSGRKLINSLTLKDHSGNVVDTYDFTYVGSRDALVDIKKNNEKFYSFQYHGVNTGGLSVPSFFDNAHDKPYDQDYWKYYNNANNTRAIHLPFDDKLANKLPNFNATRVGALKRISYPTGGFTEIEYEQNTVKAPYEQVAGQSSFGINKEKIIWVSADTTTTIADRKDSFTVTFDYPMRAVLYHKIRGNVILGNGVKLDITRLSGPDLSSYYSTAYWNGSAAVALSQPYYPIILDHARNYIREGTELNPNPYYPYPVLAPGLIIDFDPDNNCPWYNDNGDVVGSPNENMNNSVMGCISETEVDALDDSHGIFWILPGTYSFTIDVTNLAFNDIFAEIGLRWEDPAVTNGGTLPEFMNKPVGGIRVKKMIDYTEEGRYANVKNYDYNNNDGFSSARLNQTPYIKNSHLWNHYDSAGAQPTIQKLDEYLLNAYTAADLNQGTPVYYGKVTTYNTESPYSYETANGFIEYEYLFPVEDVTDTYPATPLGQDITKAVLSSEKVKKGVSYTVSSKATTHGEYRWGHVTQHPITGNATDWDVSTEHPWSFKFYKKLENDVRWYLHDYDFNAENDPALLALHDIKLYKEVDTKRLPTEVTSTTQGVSTTTSYSYDTHLLLQEEETFNPNETASETLKVEYDYPYEISETQYDSMQNNSNQVSQIVQQRSYKNNVLLNTSKINFEASNGFYRPKTIFSAKGNNSLVEELEYQYDSYGNIVSYVRNNGASPYTSFIWGYDNTVPVAKIDNASYSQVSSIVNIGQIQTLDGSGLNNTLSSLRSQLPNAQVTTYAYNPLIGVELITDPIGNTLYYSYDDLNRLKLIKDKDDKVLEQYDYHYRIEPLQLLVSSDKDEVYLNETVNFVASTSGGTGNFLYSWEVKNTSNNVVLEQLSNSPLSSYTVTSASSYTPEFMVTCTVTDTELNESQTQVRLIEAFNQNTPFTVSGISVVGTPSVGSDLQFSIEANGGTGNYTYTWRKVDSNGLETFIGTNTQTTITDLIISTDCQYYTIYCEVSDGSATPIEKSTVVNVTSGCSNNNN